MADFDEAVMNMKEIQECHRLTGGADYLLKVIVQDREHLDNFLLDTLMLLPGVDRVRTRVVLKEIKETTSISTDDPAAD